MTEKLLWNNLKKGQQTALETIYRMFFKDLFSYGKRFSSQDSLIEDSIQELFIELWNKRENLSETDKIKPYLYVALRRKIIAHVKKNRNNSGVELEEHHFDASLSFEHFLIEKEDKQEKKEQIEEAFTQLSARQKEILYLKFYSQLDYKEISEIMDMNYQSARNLVSRAITKLSKLLTALILFIISYLLQ